MGPLIARWLVALFGGSWEGRHQRSRWLKGYDLDLPPPPPAEYTWHP